MEKIELPVQDNFETSAAIAYFKKSLIKLFAPLSWWCRALPTINYKKDCPQFLELNIMESTATYMQIMCRENIFKKQRVEKKSPECSMSYWQIICQYDQCIRVILDYAFSPFIEWRSFESKEHVIVHETIQ